MDFLVLTKSGAETRDGLKPKIIEYNSGGGPSGSDPCSVLEKSGINVVRRGINQVIDGANHGDSISASALREGIPLFYDATFLEDVREKTGIEKQTPRKVYWGTNAQGILFGSIR